MEQPQQEKFEQWALVELFGHSRIAGMVSEQTIGGCSFLRVDVPASDGAPEFTKLYGNGAIYAISFVTEPIARAAAKSYRVRPISAYELPALANASQAVDTNPADYDDEPDGYR